MKIKLFAILALLAVAAGTQAANVSIQNINVPTGTASVAVPLLISPSAAGETIGAMNISFAAGGLADAIPITNGTFSGSIWDTGGSFFGTAGTPSTHSVLSAVAMLAPLQIPAGPGNLVTYTLNTSGLGPGSYLLNPNHQVQGIGSSADTALTFATGLLTISGVVIPEPSTVALTAVFTVLGLGVALKRRRG
jgi:hypothetical protein